MGLYADVTDYGAVGDGSTDDTSDIQDAIDAVAMAGGGVVYFPPSSVGYKVTSSLEAKDGVQLRLDQMAVIQKAYSSSGIATALIRNENASTFDKISRFAITGGTLTADTGSVNDGVILGLHGDDIVIQDVSIDGYAGSQAMLIGGDRNRVANVSITNPDHAAGVGGIRLFGGSDNVISGCHVESGDDALQFVPIASDTIAALYDQSIDRSVYIGCTGTSFTARFLAVLLTSSDADYVTDAAINADDETLTSASDPFTASDVGKWVAVEGAGLGGSTLITTISSYTEVDSVELSEPAFETVSGAAAGIRLLGGSITNSGFVSCSGRGSSRRVAIMNASGVAPIRNIYAVDCSVGLEKGLTLSSSGDVYIQCGDYGSVANVRLNGVRVIKPQYRSISIPVGGSITDVALTRCETEPGMAPIATLEADSEPDQLSPGAYQYQVTFIVDTSPLRETLPGAPSTPITADASHTSASLTAIPTGPDGVIQRRLYRTEADGSTFKLLDTITDNIATIYTDVTADGSLGAAAPTRDSSGLAVTTDSTLPQVAIDGATNVLLSGHLFGPQSTDQALIGSGSNTVSSFIAEDCRHQGIGDPPSGTTNAINCNNVDRPVLMRNRYELAPGSSAARAVRLGSGARGALVADNDMSSLEAATKVNDLTTAQDTVLRDNLGYKAQFVALRRFATGEWYGPSIDAFVDYDNDVAFPNGTACYTPFEVSERSSFSDIGVYVGTAGSSGSVIRLAVYRDDGAGHPGELVEDAGTISGESTGWKELSFSPDLDLVAGLYWLCGIQQGGPSTLPRLGATGLLSSRLVGSIDPTDTDSRSVGYFDTGVTGAAPGTASIDSVQAIAIIWVMLKAS